MYLSVNIGHGVVTNCRLHFTMIFARHCSHLCHFLIHELNCFLTDSMQRIRPIDTSADPAVWMMTEGRWSLFNLLRSLIKTVESGNTRRFNKISSYKFTWCPKQPFFFLIDVGWNTHFPCHDCVCHLTETLILIRGWLSGSTVYLLSHLFMACEVRINCSQVGYKPQ